MVISICYLGGRCSRRWCLPFERRCLHFGMARGCMACMVSHSAGHCTLKGIGNDTSPLRLHRHHHWGTERGSARTRWHLAYRSGRGRQAGRCRCRWNQRRSIGHHLHMDWKHMGLQFGTFYLENKTTQLIICVWKLRGVHYVRKKKANRIPDHPGGQRQR